MPIYDYVCSNCGQRTEVIHGINDPGPRFCPSCGAEGTLKKGFNTPAILYKGSGWAKKDRSSSSSTRTRASAHADSGGAGSSGDAAAPGSGSGDTGGSAKGDRPSAKEAKGSATTTSSES